MKFISIEDFEKLDLKKGDVIKVRYLSLSGEIFDSKKIIFQEVFTRGKNKMVAINYKEKSRDKQLYELSRILGIEKL